MAHFRCIVDIKSLRIVFIDLKSSQTKSLRIVFEDLKSLQTKSLRIVVSQGYINSDRHPQYPQDSDILKDILKLRYPHGLDILKDENCRTKIEKNLASKN